MRSRAGIIAAPFLVLVLGVGCSGVAALDREPMQLSPTEAGHVETQIAAALEQKAWTAAWNQEVEAGARRERLEAIALSALEDESGDADDMLRALRTKWGGLSPEGRARVDVLADKAAGSGDWKRAVDIQIEAAEDAPSYGAAWAVYRQAPADEAPDLLRRIREARERDAETGG